MQEFTFGPINLRRVDSDTYELTDSSGVIPYDYVEVHSGYVKFTHPTFGCLVSASTLEVVCDTSDLNVEDVLVFALKCMLTHRFRFNEVKIRDLEIENDHLSDMLKGL